MLKNEQNDGGDAGKAANNYAKYSGIAFQMVGIIGVFAFAGYEIDKSLKHDMQWVTALFCLLGVCLSIYLTIRQLSK